MAGPRIPAAFKGRIALAAAYRRFAAAVSKTVLADDRCSLYRIDAFTPDGSAPVPHEDARHGMSDAVYDLLIGEVLPALRALDALAPLVRDPAAGVWETLRAEFHLHTDQSFLTLNNLLGERERCHVWGTRAPDYREFADWCACRSGTADLGTPWDVARRQRRTVPLCLSGGRNLIDTGVNRVIDIVRAAGADTSVSCEGHPNGAYLGIHGRRAVREALAEAFEALDWRVPLSRGGAIFVYMPVVRDVSERDAAWRTACAALEARFGPVPQAAEDARPEPPHTGDTTHGADGAIPRRTP